MAIKLSREDLELMVTGLSSYNFAFAQSFQDFLKKQNTHYYFSGREPSVSYLKITIIQIEKILADISKTGKKYSALRDVINQVYQAGKITCQDSIFLYGRNSL
jgi:hypothetical protein